MQRIIDKLLDEPVLLANLAAGVLNVLVVFGAGLTDGQTTAIVALVQIVANIIARQAVTPVRKIPVEPFPQVELTDGGMPTEG